MPNLRSSLTQLKARCASLRSRLATTTLVIATLVMSHPAFADLPTMTAPPGVDEGDIIGMWRGYAKIAINTFILIIGGLAFIVVASGAMEKVRTFGKGKVELADVKEYIIVGVLVLAVIVFLLTAANKIL